MSGRHVTPFSGRLAIAVAALSALAVGAGVGNLGIAVGVAGALAFAWGAGALDTDANSRRALGSVATVVGGLAVLAGAVTAGTDVLAAVVSAVALLALAAIAVDTTAGIGEDTLSPLLASLGSSVATVIAGVAVASLLHVAFGLGLAAVLFAGAADASLSTPLGAFVALQLLAVLVAVLLRRARAVVEGWFPGGVPVDAWEEFEPLALSLREVPKAYWGALAVQVVALAVGGNVVVEWLLASTWLFGAAVEGVLRSGVLHGALLLVLALEAVVVGGEFVRTGLNSALSPNPPRSLSYAAGGVAVCLLVPLAAAAVSLTAALTGVGNDPLLFEGVWGTTATVLAMSVVVLGVVFAVEVSGVALAEWSPLPDAAGFAMGAGLLFLAAVAAAPAGAPAVVTFVGVAAALVAWDLGDTAVDLGGHLGDRAETRRAEIVHATGSVGVAVVGVALAAASVHLLGPIEVPGTTGRAVAAVGLSIVALLAFVLALDRRPHADAE